MHEFRVSGQRWTIHRENRPGLWGECDNESKRITIHPQLRTRKRLEILIHEMCHALFWDASEEAVTEAGKTIAAVLLADGWKRGKIKPIKAIDMKVIRESHIEDEGVKFAVVEFQAGDTIPANAINVDGEWHTPKPSEEENFGGNFGEEPRSQAQEGQEVNPESPEIPSRHIGEFGFVNDARHWRSVVSSNDAPAVPAPVCADELRSRRDAEQGGGREQWKSTAGDS